MKRAACLLGILFLLVTPAIGGTTASITGIATDDRTPLAGVAVKILSPAMQGTRTTTTDINGRYAIVAVPPGEYTVSFEAGGMQAASTKVTAGVGQTGRADVALRPKEREETQHDGETVAAAVETKAVQTNLTATTVDALPVNRDIASTVSLASGSTASVAPNLSNWMLDGGITNDPASRAANAIYVEDAIQETTVLSGAIPAEYGRFQGGVVNSITRSGGNEWSGSFRDSFSNPSWTAPSPYQNIENTDELEQVFEATFGGRILRDQLWFFAAGRQFTDTIQLLYALSPSWGRTTQREDRRGQGKLTGQISDHHSLVASYLRRPFTDIDWCIANSSRCAEPSAVDPERSNVSALGTVRYTGMITPRVAAEAYWNAYDSKWQGSGGDSTDQVTGTWGADVNTGAFFGAPIFSPLYEDERNSREYGLKATWFLATVALGTHNIAAGYDHWASDVVSNNYQSGSDFAIYTFSEQSYDLHPGDVFKPTIAPGDIIQWMPIPVLDHPSNKQMQAAYLNDAWDLGAHWSFNVGLRYDLNDLVDESGTVVSDTGAFQPRLAAVWDMRGDGRYRVNASYGRYSDLISNWIVSAGSGGGYPMSLYWEYGGPVIEGLPTFEAFKNVFDWFNAQCDSAGNCGNENMETLVWGSGGATSVKFAGSLRSPEVDEASLGFSFAPAPSAFVRIDFMTRKWSHWIGTIVTQDTGQTTDVFGNPSDWQVYDNVDAGREHKFDAVFLQGAYRFGSRWNLGGNYTWSKTTGRDSDGSDYYPELTSFERGHLVSVNRSNSLRAWVMYDVPTSAGTFNFSVLESFDSGAPYSVAGAISTKFNPNALAMYAQPPQAASYSFEDPGTFHWGNATSTDVAVRYQLPVRWSGAFLDFNVTNVFDESAQTGGNTTVLTAFNSNCRQTASPTKRCALFNPFTDTPVEGVHWVKGSRFGQATSRAHYQTPRTYAFSAGVRF